MIKMSYQEAIKIQTAQIAYYRQSLGRKGILKIRHNTKPCPIDIHPEEPISIITINRLVPRGGSFESLIRHSPMEYDNLNCSWHDAIRRGLIP